MQQQGFELGIYFPAIAGNVTSYSMEYYQASKCFCHSVARNQKEGVGEGPRNGAQSEGFHLAM